jgi:hypothetical protein
MVLETQINRDINRIKRTIQKDFSSHPAGEENEDWEPNELGEKFMPITRYSVPDLTSRKLARLKDLITLKQQVMTLRLWTLGNGKKVNNYEDSEFELDEVKDPEDMSFLRGVNVGRHQSIADTQEAYFDEIPEPILLGLVTPSPQQDARIRTIFDFEDNFILNVMLDGISENGYVAFGTYHTPISRMTTREYRFIRYSLDSFFRTIHADSRSMVLR